MRTTTALGLVLVVLAGCLDERGSEPLVDQASDPATSTPQPPSQSSEVGQTPTSLRLDGSMFDENDWLLVQIQTFGPAKATIHVNEVMPPDVPLRHCTMLEGPTGFAMMGRPAYVVQATPAQEEPILVRSAPLDGKFHLTFADAFEIPSAATFGILYGISEAKGWVDAGDEVTLDLELDAPFAWSVVARGDLHCIAETDNLEGTIVRTPGSVVVRDAAATFALAGTGTGWATAYSNLGYAYALDGPAGNVFTETVEPQTLGAGHRLVELPAGAYTYSVPELTGTEGDVGLVVADLPPHASALLQQTGDVIQP